MALKHSLDYSFTAFLQPGRPDQRSMQLRTRMLLILLTRETSIGNISPFETPEVGSHQPQDSPGKLLQANL